jgi:hypothetical protein
MERKEYGGAKLAHVTRGYGMAVSVVLDKALDKAYEGKSVDELLNAPVAALAGVTDKDAEHLRAALGIKTVRDLGTNKFFNLAHALTEIGDHRA